MNNINNVIKSICLFSKFNLIIKSPVTLQLTAALECMAACSAVAAAKYSQLGLGWPVSGSGRVTHVSLFNERGSQRPELMES